MYDKSIIDNKLFINVVWNWLRILSVEIQLILLHNTYGVLRLLYNTHIFIGTWYARIGVLYFPW